MVPRSTERVIRTRVLLLGTSLWSSRKVGKLSTCDLRPSHLSVGAHHVSTSELSDVLRKCEYIPITSNRHPDTDTSKETSPFGLVEILRQDSG